MLQAINQNHHIAILGVRLIKTLFNQQPPSTTLLIRNIRKTKKTDRHDEANSLLTQFCENA
jgi:hypothetical protein